MSQSINKPVMTYDLLTDTPPQLPHKLPGFLKLATSKAPEYMRPAAVNTVFAPASAQMHDVTVRYPDNVTHEFAFMEGHFAPFIRR